MYNVVKTSDYVAVVRCVECKHRDTSNCPICYMEDGGYYIRSVNDDFAGDDNWFCANGERKEENG